MTKVVNESRYEIVVVGDCAIGKTHFLECAMKRFVPIPIGPYCSTAGVDFIVKRIDTPHDSITFKMWDVSGDRRFDFLLESYIKRSDAVLLCFDISNDQSFANIQKYWVSYLDNYIFRPNVPILFIGMKSDQKREVTVEQALALVSIYKFTEYIETSTVTGFNVEKVFTRLSELLHYTKVEPMKAVKPSRDVCAPVDLNSYCCFQ